MNPQATLPFTVVIVGRPNVGKSTLFNRIVGWRKALVHDLPGVTRDRNYAMVTREDRSFQIVDTGGLLGGGGDDLAAMVEEQVEVALEGGDLVLLVVDSKDGLLPLDAEIARRLLRSGKKAALVVNKVDADVHDRRVPEFYAAGLQPVLPLSAEHGGGVAELLEFIEAVVPAQADTHPTETAEGEHPIRIAIVGRPNVGKSSILNRLLGSERSLVSAVAGTTRDPVDVLVRHGGNSFLLVDTAGIRRKARTEQGAEILSVILAQRALRQCDVAFIVLDAGGKPTHQDAHIAGLVENSHRAGALVLNKWDLVKGDEAADAATDAAHEKFAFADYLPLERVSAHSGRRVERLLPLAGRIYRNYSRTLGTSALNKAVRELVGRVSPPSVHGKEFKIRYITQTGTAPPILTFFTNSAFPPPDNYGRYLRNGLREHFPLEGSPLLLKFRKD
jgi:GTP-binding protein